MPRLPTPAAIALFTAASLTGCAADRAELVGGAAEHPNLVLVSMDTCRYDHTGSAGYHRSTTPSLDRLAADGVSFTRAYAQSNETRYSHAAIFTGRYPGEMATLDDDYHLPAEVLTITDVLKLYGYVTAAFTAGAHVKGHLGFAEGFDLYLDDLDFASFYHSVQAAELWLDEPPEGPFFMFVHGYDCHSNYRKPLFFEDLFDPGYRGLADQIAEDLLGIERIWKGRYYKEVDEEYVRNSEGHRYLADAFFQVAMPKAAASGSLSLSLSPADLYHLEAHYDGGLAYADLWLGMLLAALEDQGLLDQTVVAVLSDHGEGLADYEYFHHRPSLREAILHVPMVIRIPGTARQGQRIDQLVRTIDLAPTLIELLGVPPMQGIPGNSLVPLLEGGELALQPSFAESRYQVSVRVPGEQLVLDRAALDPRGEGAVGDGHHYYEFPGELPASQPPVGADALALRLHAWHEGIDPITDEPLAIDPELQRVLRERGYW